jgi:transposase-like protein
MIGGWRFDQVIDVFMSTRRDAAAAHRFFNTPLGGCATTAAGR